MKFKLLRFYTLSISDNKACQICHDIKRTVFRFALLIHKDCLNAERLLPSENFSNIIQSYLEKGYLQCTIKGEV